MNTNLVPDIPGYDVIDARGDRNCDYTKSSPSSRSPTSNGERSSSKRIMAKKDLAQTPTTSSSCIINESLAYKYGWKVGMNHKFPETWGQIIWPRLRQIPELVPMAIRFLIYRVYMLFKGKVPFIDMFTQNGKQIYGVPIGGIGSGSIGRGFRGQFCRYHMTPGLYNYDIVHANQFILSVRDASGETKLYQKVLNGNGTPGSGILGAWDWSYNPSDGNYTGLYPRAWYTYHIPEENLVVICKQISPIIPNNYTDSTLPVAAFVWKIYNNSDEAKQVSITFTFKNGTGSKKDGNGKCSSSTFEFNGSFDPASQGIKIHGVALEHTVDGLPTTYGIGCLEKHGVIDVTHMVTFDLQNGSDLWTNLTRSGTLDKERATYEISKGELGMAVNSSGVVDSNSNLEMVFSLVWDQPRIVFKGNKTTMYKRRYNRYVSRKLENKSESEGVAGVKSLLETCLSKYKEWDEGIENWQNPILTDEKLPTWFKSALFNELYFISDGGTNWIEYEPILGSKNQSEETSSIEAKYTPLNQVEDSEDVRSEFGRFGYLEGHEYRMYNTYDVHFYSSFALAILWPKLQLSIQYDFAETIPFEDSQRRIHLFDGKRGFRKTKNTVPHDLGDPWDQPWIRINSYLVHDVSEWRDLNLKFVLQVYRDYKFTGDKKYLSDMLPSCTIVMQKTLSFDSDGDGLIENSGSADQTYDSWIMKGPSAYCSNLWLASLHAMIQMLKDCPDATTDSIQFYQEILDKGLKSYQSKLWTGSYYKFDMSSGDNGTCIMSDQLCGHWYLAHCGLKDRDAVFPKSNVTTALHTIYDKNVMGYCDGKMGAVNGMNADGSLNAYSIQSEECWTGVNYGLASTLILNGMIEEGFKTAEGIYRTVYERIGMGFETPEALVMHSKHYRSIGYMRPLCIWSMFHAWNEYQKRQE